MADQTHGAVDSLLGLLSTAIKDEARLLGGVQGDMQFIKDEMDSMNGFLLHLTKTETEHNDQHRAWMKQVRDIACIAQDCIELYVRDLTPPGGGGLWASLRHLPVLLRTMPARHRLATRIRELKVRVRDVGERRLRYGVTVPEDKAAPLKHGKPAAGQDDKDAIDGRKAFLRALDDVQEKSPPASFGPAIDLLLRHTAPVSQGDVNSLKSGITSILEKSNVHTSKMLLRALHAYPHGNKQELDKLYAKLTEENDVEADEEVKVFCYSKLSTHYKSCLQYLTTFLVETRINRALLVRRWLAESMVAKEENKTLEEAGELCFSELVFRGFICPVEFGATGKIKSCKMDEHARNFIIDIARNENFVARGIPTHLERQLHIRKIVLQQRQRQQQQPQPRRGVPRQWNICAGAAPRDDYAGAAAATTAPAENKNLPLNELVQLLRSLPEEYRLNVLDLGGCNGLKKRHLKSICTVLSLKYLTLRNTNVTRLPRQINNLRQLETLDVRQTEVREDDTRRIFLPKLKHLLAGRLADYPSDNASGRKVASLSTVRLPRDVGGMTNLEILSHVRVSRKSSVLGEVALLKNLRKLGVVLHGDDQAGVRNLLRVIGRLSNIRSLSVWIISKHSDTHTRQIPTAGDGVNLEWEGGDGDATLFTRPARLESLNISGKVRSTGFPTWVRDLANLSKVTLCETSLPDPPLQTLGKLQGLRCLRLRGNAFQEAKLIFNAGEFSSLECLLIEDGTMAGIDFQLGAAPKLKKIVWWRSAGGKEITSDMVTGTQHLPLPVELNFRCNSSLHPLKQGIAAHPDGIAEGLARDITITEAVEES